MPELIFNNEDRFVDITDENIGIRYADTEIVEGHVFRYIAYGVFAADPAFEISCQDFCDFVVKYRDVVYVVELLQRSDDWYEERYKVIFAYEAKKWHNRYAMLNYLNWHGKENDQFNGLYDVNVNLHPVCYQTYDQMGKLNTKKKLPKSQNAFAPIPPENVKRNGLRLWIMVDEKIGFEVEKGIYYFPCRKAEIGIDDSLPCVDLNTRFRGKHVAAICHAGGMHLSTDAEVEYMAIGREYFGRLREINRILGGYRFYHEYNVLEKNEPPGCQPFDDEKTEQKEAELHPEEGAEELVKGLGFFHLEVRFERPFFESGEFTQYDMAYKLGCELVLVTHGGNEIVRECHDLRFLSGLYVKKNTRLRNGIDYPVIHAVIDCREERLKQVLTPEAYELYKQEIEREKER